MARRRVSFDIQGLAIDRDGDVLVADAHNLRVQVFTSGGQFLRSWGQPAEK